MAEPPLPNAAAFPVPVMADNSLSVNEQLDNSRKLLAAQGPSKPAHVAPPDPKSIEAQAQAWNGHAKFYERSMERVSALFADNTLVLAGYVSPLSTPKTLLDIACGPGRFAVSAAKLGFEVTAIDCAEKMVEFARQRASSARVDVTAKVIDGQTLDGLQDGAFDVVTSHFGITVFPGREIAWQNVQRVLKPGGRLLLSTWSIEGFPITPAIYALFNAEDAVQGGAPPFGPPHGPPQGPPFGPPQGPPHGPPQGPPQGRNDPDVAFDPSAADRFNHADSLKAEVEAAGFTNVSVFSLHHDACFTSCEECVETLLDNVMTALTLRHKKMESVKICMAHYVNLLQQGINPFTQRNAPPPPKLEDGFTAEKMEIWKKPVIVPACANVAIAEKPL